MSDLIKLYGECNERDCACVSYDDCLTSDSCNGCYHPKSFHRVRKVFRRNSDGIFAEIFSSEPFKKSNGPEIQPNRPIPLLTYDGVENSNSISNATHSAGSFLNSSQELKYKMRPVSTKAKSFVKCLEQESEAIVRDLVIAKVGDIVPLVARKFELFLNEKVATKKIVRNVNFNGFGDHVKDTINLTLNQTKKFTFLQLFPDKTKTILKLCGDPVFSSDNPSSIDLRDLYTNPKTVFIEIEENEVFI